MTEMKRKKEKGDEEGRGRGKVVNKGMKVDTLVQRCRNT